jgi:hypothetical protein
VSKLRTIVNINTRGTPITKGSTAGQGMVDTKTTLPVKALHTPSAAAAF